MRLSDVKYKKYMIAASGLMGIILLLLVIFNIILPEQKTTEIEKAIVKMLQETNQKIGADYIKMNHVREQCRDMMELDKPDSGQSLLHVNYVNIQELQDIEVKLPEYDINQITEDSLKETFYKAVTDQVKQRMTVNHPSSGIKSIEILIGENQNDGITASVDPKITQFLKQESDSAIESKCESLYYESEDYKKVSVIHEFKESVQNDNIEGILDDLHITGIEKQKEGHYAVSFNHYPMKLFSEAVTSGYNEFDTAYKPPYFGSLPEDKVISAFSSGIAQEKEHQAAESKTLMLLAGDDLGGDYQSFIEEIHRSYDQSLQKVKEALNSKFLVARKPMPDTKVISGKRKGRPIAIRANRRHVWLRFYRIPGKNIRKKGKLVLSCVVKRGETLHINLPVGYYKLIQGDANPSTKWYGTQYGFATSGNYRCWNDAIHIGQGLMYSLTTGITNGNASSTSVPWNDV